jgi:aldehyde:ferredoxin oxidoreductase
MINSPTFQYLLIDLTRSQSEQVEIPPEVIRDYPSGTALATWLLHSHTSPGCEPLSPENILVLAPGIFSGLPVPGATTMGVVARSPLTGFWTGGAMGGEFAWALARTGWSAIVIRGKSPELTYLLLDEGRVFFRNASRLSGYPLSRTVAELKQDWGDSAAVLSIGPAGEALVRFALIGDGSPEPGLRGGLGAVLGSKNLKALVLRPDRGISIKQPVDLVGYISSLRLQPGGADATERSIEVLEKLLKAGALPARNFQGVFKQDSWIDEVKKFPYHKKACIGCSIACLKLSPIEIDDDGKSVSAQLGLFPEHVWAAGPMIGLNSLEDTAQVLVHCQEMGLEPVSFGGVAAWAAEALEKGIDLGLDFDSSVGFGRVNWLADLPESIVTNPAINELLGLGAKAAAHKIGADAVDLAAHYEGLELTYSDPRRNYQPLSFLGPALLMLSLQDMSEVEDGEARTRALIRKEDQWALRQTLGLCPFAADVQENVVEIIPDLLRLKDGSNVNSDTLAHWARGLIHLIKTFDWSHGWRPFDQNLSPRFFREDLSASDRVFSTLDRLDRQKQMKEYFSLRGWSEDGRPLP